MSPPTTLMSRAPPPFPYKPLQSLLAQNTSGPGCSKQDEDNPGLVQNLNSDFKA